MIDAATLCMRLAHRAEGNHQVAQQHSNSKAKQRRSWLLVDWELERFARSGVLERGRTLSALYSPTPDGFRHD
jgi:hypothetical protein